MGSIALGMDKLKKRVLIGLVAVSALAVGGLFYVLRDSVTDLPFQGRCVNEIGVIVQFKSDTTAIMVLPDDRPELYRYRVLSPEVWIEQQRAEIGITASLDELMPDVTHVIELYLPTDTTGTWPGPDFFYRVEDDTLYAPPFFGVFHRASAGVSNKPNRKIAILSGIDRHADV